MIYIFDLYFSLKNIIKMSIGFFIEKMVGYV